MKQHARMVQRRANDNLWHISPGDDGHRERSGEHAKDVALFARSGDEWIVLRFNGIGLHTELVRWQRRVDDVFYGQPKPPNGLSIWEGSVRYPNGDPEEDPVLEGAFRSLTESEWLLLQTTGCPWET